MFIVSNVISGVAEVLNMILEVYMWALVINAVLSWFSPDPYNPLVRALYQITEPTLRPIRRIIRHIIPIESIGIDFSPMVAIAIIIFLRRALIGNLFELAMRIR